MGCGWTHSFNHALKFYGVEGGAAKVSWIDGTGSEKFFSTTAHVSGNINLSATLTNPPGVYVTFTRAADGTYSIREKNGLTYQFETLTGGPTNTGLTSKLQTITDRNANALTLTYTTGNLTAVRDALARGLDFTYTGTRISQVNETANLLARTHQYTYEADGDLATYKNPAAVALAADAGPVTYAYYTTADGVKINHSMLSYTLPNTNGMKFEYYANGRTFRHSTLACATTPTAPTCQTNTFTYNLMLC